MEELWVKFGIDVVVVLFGIVWCLEKGCNFG